MKQKIGKMFRGGQLVFDWDRLENFLLISNQPISRLRHKHHML